MIASQPHSRLSDVVAILRAYPRRWMAPAVGVALLCAAYAVCKPRVWQATQTMLVRNEANVETTPGRFRDIDEMKVSQETILEVLKSHRVLSEALMEVGPARGASWGAAPSPDAIDDLREALSLKAPSGAEFGKTEISYLAVQDRDRERAVALAAAVGKRLEVALRRLRDAKAQSMVDELLKTVAVAEGELSDATGRLSGFEKQLGADLSDLRNMEITATGDSDLRRRLNSIEDELRIVAAERQSAEVMRSLLRDAQKHPENPLATPSRLLQSQPALARLKDGLVTAQLKVSQLRGQMTDSHPQVIAAREEELEIVRQLNAEVAVALRGVETDLQLAAQRNDSLQVHRRELLGRLEKMAGLRPQYSSVLQEVTQKNEAVAIARRKLAAAQATQVGAQMASLVTFVDSPMAGKDPLGPGRASILLLGIVAGLAVGGAVLFLTVPGQRTLEGQFAASQRGWGLDTTVSTSAAGQASGVAASRRADLTSPH